MNPIHTNNPERKALERFETRCRAVEAVHRVRELLTADLRAIVRAIKSAANRGADPAGAGKRSGDQTGLFLGLIGMALWLPLFLIVVPLNSQVVSLFIPPGTDSLILPGLGEVDPLGLFVAAIVSLAQVLGILAACEPGPLPQRLFGGIAFAAALAFSVIGGYLRGKLIGAMGAADGTVGPLSGQGPLVSALLGALVPLSDAVAGLAAFRGVLLPVGPDLLRLPRIVRSWLFLKLWPWTHGSDAHSGLVHPTVSVAESQAASLKLAAEQVSKDVKPITAGALQLIKIAPDLNNYQAAADRIESGLADEVKRIQAHPLLADPNPKAISPRLPHSSANEQSLTYKRQAERLQKEARQPLERALANARDAFSRLGTIAGDLQADKLIQGRQLLAELEARRASILHERQEVISLLLDLVRGPGFHTLPALAQQTNLQAIRKILVALDGRSGAVTRPESADRHHSPLTNAGPPADQLAAQTAGLEGELEAALNAPAPDSVLQKWLGEIDVAGTALDKLEPVLAAAGAEKVLEACAAVRDRKAALEDRVTELLLTIAHRIEDLLRLAKAPSWWARFQAKHFPSSEQTDGPTPDIAPAPVRMPRSWGPR